jgi:hypothetical protein
MQFELERRTLPLDSADVPPKVPNIPLKDKTDFRNKDVVSFMPLLSALFGCNNNTVCLAVRTMCSLSLSVSESFCEKKYFIHFFFFFFFFFFASCFLLSPPPPCRPLQMLAQFYFTL